jgi:hypothetical protein
MSAPLVILRADRASRQVFNVGDKVYHGRDCYGCASDDTRITGVEHVSVSPNKSGIPFFTIPREDVGRVS